MVLVEFESKNKLLGPLLEKYVYDKVPKVNININNYIHQATYGEQSILLYVPENKILNNIVLLYKYLLRAKLPANIIKKLPSSKLSYSNLGINHFSVSVMGKCKNFIKLIDSNADRVKSFLKNIGTIDSTDREDVEGSEKKSDCPCVIFFDNLSNDGLLYLAILSGYIPSKISKNSIEFYPKEELVNFVN
jgi:hypothetical protein